jgi:hypothetical protein
VVRTRAEHLQWAKDRALKYVDAGDTQQAFASMGSDLKKHPELENHSGIEFGFRLQFAGHLKNPDEMRRFIEDFN